MDFFQSIASLLQSSAAEAALWGFATSLALCVLIVVSKGWHGHLSLDAVQGVQKFHSTPTPRVGGLPMMLGITLAWAEAPQEVRDVLGPVLLASLPAFIFGLAEDITKRVGVMPRLLATMASGLLAWWITDYSLSRVDIVGVDWILRFKVISVIFSAFAVGGIANSINIIDGFNGLASTMSALAFIGIGVIAWQVGDRALAGAALILCSCVWGFFWVNWPLGKIFLGDGGSYAIGFALAWLGVELVERNPSVTAFSVLLICVHPVTEVLFSIFRRRVKKLHPGHPDRLHFHSLVKQRYVRRWFDSMSLRSKNSVTGLLLGLPTFSAIWYASQTYHSVAWSVMGFVGFSLGFVTLYVRMVSFRWRSPIGFLFSKPR